MPNAAMQVQLFFMIFSFSAQVSQVVVAEINPDTLGVVDRSLLVRFLNEVRFNSQATTADLYINNGGLYLLPENIQSRGIVSRVCGYGYTKVEFESLLWKPNTTEIDPMSLVRLFVYVVLLRAVPGDASAYYVVYPPAVLHHDINPDCLSVADGLNWMTESGDRIGAFIPNDCVAVENLQRVFVTEEVRRQFRTLCPSQVNLIPSLEYPSNGTYVANTSSVSIEEVIDGLMLSVNQFEEVSVHINMNVTTIPEVTDLPTFAPIPASTPTPQISVMILAVSISVGLLLVLSVCTTAIILSVFCGLKKTKQNNIILQFTDDSRKDIPEIKITSVDIPPNTPGMSRYNAPPTAEAVEMVPRRIRVNSGFIRHMSESELLIPGRHLKLLETVGQGEFGVVYRGHLTGWQERTTAELVAVKTLKSCFTVNDIEDLMKESEKMKRFDHLNVLGLIGVCIDSGEAPYVVMPFMANGSLLMYLKKERPKLTIVGDAGDQSVIEDAQRKLLSLCLQIANGMSYLAMEKFVHRDLAARNCMIDQNFVIKVADFGLSEDVNSRNYFRQVQGEEGSAIKLPIRWMALESLLDGVFTEKTDVWSYGVTCWEVFSLGHTPYPAVESFSLMKFLRDGGRLEKPTNAACSLQVYDLMCECWIEVPDKRPSFKDLVISVNSLLEGVAGYLDFSAFSAESHWKGYDHLCRYDELDTCK